MCGIVCQRRSFTTGYSGNVDFCVNKDNVDLVDYKLIKVKKDQYPFGKDQVWADADVEHAAKLMKNFVKKNEEKKNVRNFEEFSTKYIGEKYKNRLFQIIS